MYPHDHDRNFSHWWNPRNWDDFRWICFCLYCVTFFVITGL